MRHPLIFLHLPKAAGTSFKSAIQELLPPETLVHDVNGSPDLEVVRALMAMDPNRRAQLKAIMAHVPYGLHTLFPGAKYVTMLREPVARVLSTYYFAKSRTEFEFSKKIAAGMTIEEFAADVFNENTQVRRLMKYPDISRDDVFLDPPIGRLTRAHLDDAKDTLRRCAVVGVAERYDEFLDCVSAEFGLPPIPRRDDNVTALPWHREQVSARTIERLSEINQFDVELYEYAKKLVGKQVAKHSVKPAASRHMRPLYERASAREALETENRRLGGKLAHQTAERERVTAELSNAARQAAQLVIENERLRGELTRHKDERARLAAELSDVSRQAAELVIENERVRGELARHKEERARLAAEQVAERERVRVELAWHQAESARLTSEQAAERERFQADLSWHRAENARLAADQASERERFAAELSWHQAESARLAAEQASELSSHRAESARLSAEQAAERERFRTELSSHQAETARVEARLAGIIDELRLQLKAVYSSSSWKITEPLRKLSALARKAIPWRARPPP